MLHRYLCCPCTITLQLSYTWHWHDVISCDITFIRGFNMALMNPWYIWSSHQHLQGNWMRIAAEMSGADLSSFQRLALHTRWARCGTFRVFSGWWRNVPFWCYGNATSACYLQRMTYSRCNIRLTNSGTWYRNCCWLVRTCNSGINRHLRAVKQTVNQPTTKSRQTYN